MDLILSIENACNAANIPDDEEIESWVLTTLSLQSEHDGITELGLRIVDRNEISQLNTTYRKKDGPTNILSFPFDLPPGFTEPGNQTILGDIVACSDVIEHEAKQQHKPLKAHWAHMIVHGTLHLLGYDHQDDLEAREMEDLEISLLARLNFPNPYTSQITITP